MYSWGRIRACTPNEIYSPENHFSRLSNTSDMMLAIGNLRSYGDSCYNDNGFIINNKNLKHFIHFDHKNGYLTAEAGVLLKEILRLVVPHGWFLAVTPGTWFITLGGAVANDVHGKNHHQVGSFGNFTEEFELVRSDGTKQICSRTTNPELFYATIGGIGLTGWITWIKIKLLKIQNPYLITKGYKFGKLDEFFELNKELESVNTYTVSWIDCTAKKSQLGRGIYYVGRHSEDSEVRKNIASKPSVRRMPITPPFSLINKVSLKLFNHVYFNRHVAAEPQCTHYEQFFYPLDSVLNWNRIYGKKGFYQYQCVVPKSDANIVVAEMLDQISKSGLGSFLAVLKTFGNKHSGGLMSFPREGITLALDFANNGKVTENLFKRLDDLVIAANGALYIAKDMRMSQKMFEASYPNLTEFTKYVDPQFSSNLWRRVRTIS